MRSITLLLFLLLMSSFSLGSDFLSGPADLLHLAKSTAPSDKFSSKHSYHQMYGMYLLPYCEIKHQKEAPVKMLEIGLGCKRADHNPIYSLLMKRDVAQEGMFNGYKVWKAVFNFPNDELWFAEHDKKCLKMRKRGMFTKHTLQGLNILQGDQSDPATLSDWMEQSKGNFDIIIDDGSHKNKDIYTSFTHLWSHVKPGGLYFIEDLQVSRDVRYDNSNGKIIMADVIKDWIEQLMIPPARSTFLRHDDSSPLTVNWKHSIPRDINWITCQMEACVISKCLENSLVRCS